MLDYFVVENNQYVSRIDSNEFAQPLTHYVEHPIDIDFHFNSIAYNKGLLDFTVFRLVATDGLGWSYPSEIFKKHVFL